MTMPSQADLHINVPLTNVSVAYMQNSGDYLATKVFPKVPVKHQSDIYYKYSKSDWRRTDVQRRAPSTESPGVGWNVTTDSYFAHVYAVHKDIDDQLRANADNEFDLDSTSSKFITNQLLIKRDIDWSARYFVTGVWGTEYTGIASGTPTGSQFIQWDQALSDPLTNVSTWLVIFRQLTGFKPNFMVIGALVMVALQNHPAILDRIKYTQRGVITEELIAAFFGIDKLYVAYATQATGPQVNDAVAQDAAASYAFIANPKSVLIGYAPPSPALMTPSAGYTFTWSGYSAGNGEGLRIKNFRMEHIASDRIEAEMTYDMKVVSPDMGIFLSGVVA